jgi:Beta-lactamase superfamily domain
LADKEPEKYDRAAARWHVRFVQETKNVDIRLSQAVLALLTAIPANALAAAALAESGGASLGYLPDHEPALAATIEDRQRDWISGAGIAGDVDVLLHDAQYFEDEYEMRIGWGHSSVADAVAFTHAVGARRLVLFHHDPRHDDGLLERLETRAQSLAGRNGAKVMLAREGLVVELT